MAFEGRVLTISALMQIDLPAHTVRLCDGGFVKWAADTFTSKDSVLGTVEAAEAFGERIGDEAPGGKITFMPPPAVDSADLKDPTWQGSRMRVWLAEVDRATGLVSGTPELTADLAVDTLSLRISRGQRKLDIEFVSAAERLFMVYRGNALNDRFHELCFSGETGMANATGQPRSTAWGTVKAGQG
jgi:hypothetical protein